MIYKRYRLLANATLVSSLALAVACQAPKDEKAGDPAEAAAPEAPAADEGPVARVNGTDIPREDFKRQMDRTRARFERAGRQIAPALEARLKENLVRKLVDDELIRQKAKAEGVSVTADELNAKYDEHKKRFGTEEMYKSFLERTQQSEEDVKSDLERNLLRDQLFAKLMEGQTPTADDAKKYYEENQDKYKQRDQVRASHILFKVGKGDPEDVKKQKLQKAKDVLALAKKPKADFAALAKEHSEGPTASKGGDLGSFSRGRMVKEFEDAAFSAKPGAVVGPVETKFGYHVIKVFEKIPERQRTFDEVKDSILTSLEARAKSKATREILKSMKTDAKIEILEAGVDLERRRPLPMRADGKELEGRRQAQPLKGSAEPVNAAHAKAALERMRNATTKGDQKASEAPAKAEGQAGGE